VDQVREEKKKNPRRKRSFIPHHSAGKKGPSVHPARTGEGKGKKKQRRLCKEKGKKKIGLPRLQERAVSTPKGEKGGGKKRGEIGGVVNTQVKERPRTFGDIGPKISGGGGRKIPGHIPSKKKGLCQV